MRQEVPKERTTLVEKESFGDLLSRLATAAVSLVRDEIDLFKQELREKAKSLRSGAMMAMIGAMVGIVALLTLDAAAVVVVGEVIGYGWAALVIGVGELIIAGILVLIGINQLKRTHLKPEGTIRSLKENMDWIRVCGPNMAKKKDSGC
jgi:uncharacterized membrane protein YqjE